MSTDGGANLDIMQWDDANFQWTTRSAAAIPVSFSSQVLLSDTNISIPGGRGLNGSSTVAAYFIGTLAPSQSVNVAITRDISDSVNFITGTLLTPVWPTPEPASASLFALGAAAFLWAGRRTGRNSARR